MNFGDNVRNSVDVKSKPMLATTDRLAAVANVTGTATVFAGNADQAAA